MIMETRIFSLLLTASLVTPILSFAGADDSVSRTQIRAELAEIQRAGYVPTSEQASYPANFQAAIARVSSERLAMVQATDYDSLTASGSRSGTKRR
jgi:hypothetical protein